MTIQEQFINQIAPLIQKHAPKYDIRVCSPIIAQACAESRFGQSGLAKYHNYFGLKAGSKWTGPIVTMKTKEEYVAGVLTEIKDNFRVYNSLEDGVIGFFEFLGSARYQNLKGIIDPKLFCETIKADGYATSTTYVTTLMGVIQSYTLTKYDPVNHIKAQQKAKFFNKLESGVYKVNTYKLNVRSGCGTDYSILTQITAGTKVTCYGYYNIDYRNIKWYYIQFTINGVKYSAYVNSNYLTKVSDLV